MTIAEALDAALDGLELKPQDSAAVALAKAYTAQIDGNPELLAKLGPLLLSVLDSLGMTPRGRAAVMGKGGARDNDPADAKHPDDCTCLPCQRARRATRVNGAASVDTPTS